MDNKGCCPSTSSNANGGSCDMKACWMTLIKGALIGGIVMFAYCWASWTFIPMHKDVTPTFSQETAASEIAPAVAKMAKDAMSAMTSAATGESELMAMKAQIGYAFLLSIFSALLLTALLKKSCGCPVRFSATVGLLIGAAAYLPNLIWFNAPLSYTLLGMADKLIAFTLAGAVIARFVLGTCGAGKGPCETTEKDKGKAKK